MAATLTWEGTDQFGTDTVVTPFTLGGTSSATINFTRDRVWATTIAASPVPAGLASIERYIRAKFTGAANALHTLKFWRSDGNTLPAGVSFTAGGLADGLGLSWAVPVTTPNADPAVPTSVPGSSNLAIELVTGIWIAPPPSISGKFIRLQGRTTGATPPGNIAAGSPHVIFSIQYHEN
jgi:hypothetical protein